MLIRNISKDLLMEKMQYHSIRLKRGGIKLIIQMPKQSPHDDKAKKEIKSILAMALQDYLGNVL